MGIYEVEDILTRYGIGWEEFERIQGMGRFQRLLETTTVEWGSTMNTRERIKIKALAGVEDGLAGLFLSAKDSRETLASRVEAYKLARVLAGIGEKDPNEVAPEKFTLTINVGETSTVVGHAGPTIEGSAYNTVRESNAYDAREDEEPATIEPADAPSGLFVINTAGDLAEDLAEEYRAGDLTSEVNDDLRSGYDDERHDERHGDE